MDEVKETKLYSEHKVGVSFVILDAGDAFTRITGENGDEWRDKFYWHIEDQADILRHWAMNFIANSIDDVSRLEGWADLRAGQITMELDLVE